MKPKTTLEAFIKDTYKEQACPVCGKEFCVTSPSWAYKKYDSDGNVVHFCSWKCLRKDEAESEKKRRKRKAVDQLDLDGNLIFTHDSIDDAADSVDGLYNGIVVACISEKKYKGYLWRYNTNGMP